jgi:exopolyphosphatase/guanosine-5'-triphosphate,3'-diphosphate pyrophosphatase
MDSRRLAAIDIGSNSTRSIIVEADSDGNFRVLDDEKEPTRIGEGMARSRTLRVAAMQRTIKALQRMNDIAAGFGAEKIQVIATSAVREAKNRDLFLRRVREEVGLNVKVISAEDEARLAFLSIVHHFDLGNQRFFAMDIGGGSAAIVSARGSHVEKIHCLALGAVRLTEKFLHSDPIGEPEYKALRKHIKKMLLPTRAAGEPGVQILIGSGGTITTIAEMHKALQEEKYTGVHGYELNRAQVLHVLDALRQKTLKERRKLPGLNPERADIIVAGVTVVNQIMKIFDINTLRVSARGIREGLILDMMGGPSRRKNFAQKPAAAGRRESVRAFAESCRYEAPHSLHVANLALSIYDQLLRPGETQFAPERDLLEAAGILHDIGYFINYTRHHKHSYHLIIHSPLVGFSPREIAIIANLARYHRRAEPSKRHLEFAQLSKADQKLVLKLAGILRLADGLDRSHSQRIRELHCTKSSKKTTLHLFSDKDIAIEIWGAQQKERLFKEIFETRVEYSHVSN